MVCSHHFTIPYQYPYTIITQSINKEAYLGNPYPTQKSNADKYQGGSDLMDPPVGSVDDWKYHTIHK